LECKNINLPIDISIECRKSKLSLKFSYKDQVHRIPLNCPFEELNESDICDIVSRTIRKVDGDITVGEFLDWIIDNDECGGALATRKKSVSHLIDLWVKREGRSLDESTEAFLDTDHTGRTVPEQWAKKYGLPHKIRQIRSLFSKRNLLLFKREGWDTGHFVNFVSYIAESTVSQPFTTDDNEVERIISFFEANRETHPVFYDIYLLAFGAGLRASEIYQVKGKDFTTFNGQHFLLLPFATKRSRLKNTNHVEKVGISPKLYEHFSSASHDETVISGGLRLHKRFVQFLKQDLGITDNKACHRLRKILGARLATTAGIYHASKTLRNSIAVCERYYSDLTSHKNDLRV
jgi:integrase